jgi:uncharacterized RDD family membrane protein YckC
MTTATQKAGESSVGNDPGSEPAGLFRRACAFAIDLCVAAAIAWGFTAVARALGADALLASTRAGRYLLERPWLLWSASHALPAWLALSFLESLPPRAGPGKRLLRLRVEASRRGDSPSAARIALRTAIKLVPWLVAALALFLPRPWDPRDPIESPRLLVLLASNLWIGIYLASAAMTRRRQSLHDLATGTVVVGERARTPAA